MIAATAENWQQGTCPKPWVARVGGKVLLDGRGAVRRYSSQAAALKAAFAAAGNCINHPDRPVRETLDGDALCQECCDAWVRGEALAARELRKAGV